MATREQLLAAVDAYFDALVARDPSRLATAPGVRNTENFQDVPLGSGLWRSVRGKLGGFCFTDTTAGSAVFFGAVQEIEKPAMIALRLRLEGDRISEIESMAVREGGVLYHPELMTQPRPQYEEVLPEAQRMSRDDLARVPHLYLDAITQDKGSIFPCYDGCLRFENGWQTVLNPDSEFEAARMGVRQQIDAGYTHHIAGGVQRRVLTVDEERGLVVAHFFFDHPGDLESVGGRVPFGYPNYMPVYEVFKTRDGRVEHIEAIIDTYPWGTKSGW